MNIKEKLAVIQQELKVPKKRPNKFGGYKYRSVEDIYQAIKPHLEKHNVLLTISDEIVEVGGRIYVKSTALLENADGEDGGIGVSAFAREQLERKKSDDSQLTGAASSYARKYALGGLFLIDNEEDPDAYEEDDSEEELDKQEAAEYESEEVVRKPRNRRKKNSDAEDFMNIPEGMDEETPFDDPKDDPLWTPFEGPFNKETGLYDPNATEDDDDTIKKDTCFKVDNADGTYNYVKLHPGDEIPEGAIEITEDEFKDGVLSIAQKKEPEKKATTRRTRKKRS